MRRSPRDVPQRADRQLPSRDLALIAVFAGMIGALGVAPPIYALGSGVPITLQTLGVMLAGSILGARRGALAVLVFLALVAIGLPLLSGGRGGLGVFTGPSAGYLVGFPLGAWTIGVITAWGGRRYTVLGGLAANVIGGILVVYLIGVPVMAWRLHTSALLSVLTASVVYLPGDLIKAVTATLVTREVRRSRPELLRTT